MTTETSLDLVRAVLSDGGYNVQEVELKATGRALAAETPYALVLCVAAEWDDLENIAEQAQAELTNMAAKHPSPRSWDLYVVVVMKQEDARFDAVREALENDIRYARKIVMADGKLEDVERQLSPLLPLKPIAELPLVDALEAVRSELLELNVDTELVASALDSFARHSEVRVP
jgi:hypothetical protein